MSEGNLDYPQLRYNEYSKQRGDLFKTNVDLGGRYDQWILTLSAGALALSIGFLEKIAPRPAGNTLFLILLAWLFLILGLLAGFVSLLTAQYSAHRQIEILDEEYRQFRITVEPRGEGASGQSAPPGKNPFIKITHMLNWISAPAFILGVIFLCCFAYSNIPVGNPQSVLPPKVDVNVTIQNPIPAPASTT